MPSRSPFLITSRQNARVRALRAAFAARRHGEIVAIEGDHLIHEALRSGLAIESVFLREDRVAMAQEFPSGVDVVLLSHEVFDSAAETGTSQGVAALVRRPESRYLPQRGDLLLIAAGLQDPGNLGTLIRSAEAFSAAAVLLTEGTVDAWNAKSLRASAGSVFRMPLVRWSDTLRRSLQQHGIRLLAAVPAAAFAQAREGPAVLPAHLTDLRGGCALMIGNEGAGLSPELLALADACITLTMPGPTESLNAAVAGSLLLYEAAQQRQRGSVQDR